MDKPIAADWAIERAFKETGLLDPPLLNTIKKAPTGFPSLHALARYIEKHEKPPVDPDRVVVEEILKAWYQVPDIAHMYTDRGMCYDFDVAVNKYKELKNG